MDVMTSQRVESSCQRFLVYLLFVWVIILSLALAATLTLVLTARPPPTQSVPFDYVLSQEITMEKGNSGEEKTKIPWARGQDIPGAELLDIKGEHLMVMKDGRYFLYVQVTLQSSDTSPNNIRVAPMVFVKQGDFTLLEGVFTRSGVSKAFTTGFMGRQVDLSNGKSITVSCSSPCHINSTNTATYLGVLLLKSE